MSAKIGKITGIQEVCYYPFILINFLNCKCSKMTWELAQCFEWIFSNYELYYINGCLAMLMHHWVQIKVHFKPRRMSLSCRFVHLEKLSFQIQFWYRNNPASRQTIWILVKQIQLICWQAGLLVGSQSSQMFINNSNPTCLPTSWTRKIWSRWFAD